MVSIIVPVYNVEKYINRCLDSILAQTVTDFECVLVDDASPDSCPLICDKYIEMDKRFKVVHKNKNEGLPKARKTGLDLSTGEFVMHVDSDDWLEENTIEILLKKQYETNANIIIGAYKEVIFNREIIKIPVKIRNYSTPLEFLLENKFRYMWGKLYRRSCFDDYYVPDNNIGEDSMVNVQIFARCKNDDIVTIEDIIYNYNRNDGNLTAFGKMENECNGFTDYVKFKSLLWIRDYLERINSFENIKKSYYFFLIDICIYRYLRYRKNVLREDIDYMYREYYLPFPEKEKLKVYTRNLINIYERSILLGKIYVLKLNTQFNIKKCILSIIRRKKLWK